MDQNSEIFLPLWKLIQQNHSNHIFSQNNNNNEEINILIFDFFMQLRKLIISILFHNNNNNNEITIKEFITVLENVNETLFTNQNKNEKSKKLEDLLYYLNTLIFVYSSMNDSTAQKELFSNHNNNNNNDNNNFIGIKLVCQTISAVFFSFLFFQNNNNVESINNQILENEIQKLWFSFLFLFMQHWSLNSEKINSKGNKNYLNFVQFFDDCKNKMNKNKTNENPLVIDAISEEDENNNNNENNKINLNDFSDRTPLLLLFSEKKENKNNKTILSLLEWIHTSWACLSHNNNNNINFLEDVLLKTRFKRTAMLYKSYAPFMISQSPMSSYTVLFEILFYFQREWKFILKKEMKNKKMCSETFLNLMSHHKKNDFWSCENAEKRNEFFEQINNNNQLNDFEIKLLLLIDELSKKLDFVLKEGNMNSYLLSTILCAFMHGCYMQNNNHEHKNKINNNYNYYPFQKEVELFSKMEENAFSFLSQEEHDIINHYLNNNHENNNKNEKDVVLLLTYPPVGRLLEHISILSYQTIPLFYFTLQLKMGENTEKEILNRQKLAFSLFQTNCIDKIEILSALYYYSVHPSAAFQVNTHNNKDYFSVLKEYTQAVEEYVNKAELQLIVNQNNNDNKKEIFVPADGEIKGPRFSALHFPLPLPKIETLLETLNQNNNNNNNAFLISYPPPCTFIQDLLVIGKRTEAAELIYSYLKQEGMNVFLLENKNNNYLTLSQCIQVILFRELINVEHNNNMESFYLFLSQHKSLFILTNSELQSQTIILLLLQQLHRLLLWVSENNNNNENNNKYFILVEELLISVVFPCLSIFPPNTEFYSLVMKIFQCFEKNAVTLQLGNSPILYLTIQHWMAAYQQNRHNCIQFQKETIFEIPINNNNKLILFRHPFARLRSKENVSLFSQILKRLNKNNLDFYYAQYFQPVLFSEPLACIDRLLLLSVGYDNSFLNLYTKLLKKESPCFFVFLFQHALQSYALKYAESESFVSSNPNFQNISKIIIITNFIVAAYLEHIRYRIKLLSTEPQLFHVIEKENETKFQILTNGVSYLFRVVEFYLRSEKRSHVLVGTELLKSMLYYFKNYSCEHLLNWSETQISSFYHFRNSRRVMTNFNVCRFRENMLNDSLLFSDVFVFGHFALETHFNKKIINENENFSVPKEFLEDDEEDVIAYHEKNKNKNNISLSIGEYILLHLLRQQFKIYKNQSDLDTTEHNIINISHDNYNTLSDLLFACVELYIYENNNNNENETHFIYFMEQMIHYGIPSVVLKLIYELVNKKKLDELSQNKNKNTEHENNNNNNLVVRSPLEEDPSLYVSLQEENIKQYFQNNNNNNEINHLIQKSTIIAQFFSQFGVPQTLINKINICDNTFFYFQENEYHTTENEMENCFVKLNTICFKKKEKREKVETERQKLKNNENNNLSELLKLYKINAQKQSFLWLTEMQKRIALEKKEHEKLFSLIQTQKIVDSILIEINEFLLQNNNHNNNNINENMNTLIIEVLLPMSLHTWRDACFVKLLLERFFIFNFEPYYQNNKENNETDKNNYQNSIDLGLTYISAGIALFYSFSKSEVKKFSFIVQSILYSFHTLEHFFNNQNEKNSFGALFELSMPSFLTEFVKEYERINNQNNNNNNNENKRDRSGAPMHRAHALTLFLNEILPRKEHRLFSTFHKKEEVKPENNHHNMETENNINNHKNHYPLYLAQIENYICEFILQYIQHSDVLHNFQSQLNIFNFIERIAKPFFYELKNSVNSETSLVVQYLHENFLKNNNNENHINLILFSQISCFPRSAEHAQLLFRVIHKLHAVETNKNYAIASSLLKVLQEKKMKFWNRQFLEPIHLFMESIENNSKNPNLEKFFTPQHQLLLTNWFYHWRLKEDYAKQNSVLPFENSIHNENNNNNNNEIIENENIIEEEDIPQEDENENNNNIENNNNNNDDSNNNSDEDSSETSSHASEHSEEENERAMKRKRTE